MSNNNYCQVEKYFIYIFLGICFFSLCYGQDSTCGTQCTELPSPCDKVHCPGGHVCVSTNGKTSCQHVCANVTCGWNTWCSVAYPENCQGSGCYPYAVCNNPCDNFGCKSGTKCYLEDGICLDDQSGIDYQYSCPVPVCKPPCDSITCPPYTSCYLRDGRPTCQNLCDTSYNILCENNGLICCTESNGTSGCRHPGPIVECFAPCSVPNVCPDQDCITVPKPVCCYGEICCGEAKCIPK